MEVLILLLLISLQTASSSRSVIAVHDPKSEMNQKCINGTSHQYLMEDLVHLSLNDTQVRICSPHIELSLNITILYTKNLSIMGYGYPIISCPDDTSAGFSFIGALNLELMNFTILNCGLRTRIDKEPMEGPSSNLKASINVQNSTNVHIADVQVMNGPGTGLSLFYNDGVIKISYCTFKGNGQDKTSGGNGVYTETYDSDHNNTDGGLTAEYLFDHCHFIENNASTGNDDIIKGFSRFDKGGGLCIYIRGNRGVFVLIVDSTFQGNEVAHYGGGIMATFHGKARDNTISVINSEFSNNTAKYGGGNYIGYLHASQETPMNCSYIFKSDTFFVNSADFGGGTSLFSTQTMSKDVNAEVYFENCTWRDNTGQYGAAIAVLPNAWNLFQKGYLPTPIFKDCTIESNVIKDRFIQQKENFYQFSKGAGAFYCSSHTIIFRKETHFLLNNGSALYLGSCLVTFDEYSVVNFFNNSGYNGGAIYQLASEMYVSNNSRVYFNHNTAYDKGGAIFQHSFDIHVFDYSKTCFIDYVDEEEDIDKRNISVEFLYNEAGTGNDVPGYGHSIFASSLLPCYSRFSLSASNISFDIFKEIGNFTFTPKNRSMDIVTAVNRSSIPVSHLSDFIPGKEIQLLYNDTDDLNQTVHTDYLVTIRNKPGATIRTNQNYSHIAADQTLSLYGKVKDRATVILSATTARQIALSFEVEIQPCPPGFIQQNLLEEKSGPCICSDDTESQYLGIKSCNLTSLRAYRTRGIWIGYETNQNESEDSLMSCFCPPGFCSSEDNLLLPSTANREELNEMVCTASRKGVLCGHCNDNSSVYMHSLQFSCKSNEYCELGWIFYILSDMLPVTIIFLVIIIFNIPFTSGAINGFIFYCQVVSMFHVSADDSIKFPSPAQTLNRVSSFIYLAHNLFPFILDELSFCLWEKATALDVLAFSYVTLVYSFTLVIVVILVISKCLSRCNFRPLRNRSGSRLHSLQGSIIHGLTAFLVLCYAQCTFTSILLLASAKIHHKGSDQNSKSVVYYNGEIIWMSSEHLPYAIPALIFLVLISIPPITLLIYPLHYKVLSALRLAESKHITFLFNPLERLKPFLDSFQSCFKDEYRFFSGLYFVYRFLIMMNMGINYLQDSFIVLEVQLIFMLILHAVCQPYKKRAHNIVDTLLFGNLALINAITMYNFYNVNSKLDYSVRVDVTTWIQTVLIFMPLFVTVIFLVKKITSLICRKTSSELVESERLSEGLIHTTRNSYGTTDS